MLKHYLSQAVGKHEQVVVLHNVQKGQTILKLCLGFTAKADDLKINYIPFSYWLTMRRDLCTDK